MREAKILPESTIIQNRKSWFAIHSELYLLTKSIFTYLHQKQKSKVKKTDYMIHTHI